MLLTIARANPDWIRAADRERLRKEGAIVWDAVLLFDRRTSRTEALPKPAFYGFPVVDSIDGLDRAIRTLPSAAPR